MFKLIFFFILLFASGPELLAQDNTAPLGSSPADSSRLMGEQKENRFEVQPVDLPPRMRETLDRHSKYEGWDTSPVYYEKNTEQYLINIVKENSTRSYRFNKAGEPLPSAQPMDAGENNR